MGTSTNGQICFGTYFPEDFEFPWGDRDVEEWWLIESGWKWEGENPWTDSGDYAPGFSRDDPRIDAWFDSRRDWIKSHPLPFVKVNYQSGECPAYILACPSSVMVAHRGSPSVFDPSTLYNFPSSEMKALVDFCMKYKLQYDTRPSWYISSYWG